MRSCFPYSLRQCLPVQGLSLRARRETWYARPDRFSRTKEEARLLPNFRRIVTAQSRQPGESTMLILQIAGGIILAVLIILFLYGWFTDQI